MDFVRKPLPMDLPVVAQQWKDFLKDVPREYVIKNGDAHIENTFSVYTVKFDFYREDGVKHLHYAGMTSRHPKHRASEHMCELMNCKTTTFVAKASIYTADVLRGIEKIKMALTVQESNIPSKGEAEEREKELSAKLRRKHGDGAVLTKPRGNKKRA